MRTTKGLKLEDRYHDFVRKSDRNTERLFDICTRSKVPQDLEISGKPNLLMSFTSIENDKYVTS